MAIPASCSAPTPASSSAPSATGKPDEGLCAPLARCCVAIRGREDPPLRPIQTQCELLNASDPSAMLDDASCVIAVRAIREVLHASPAIPAVCTPVVARDQTGSVP
jgi:hypothetical protein